MIIIEYMGEVITLDECLDRMSKYKRNDDFYFAALGRNSGSSSGGGGTSGGFSEQGHTLMLDASKAGSIARFANHSCEPNCVMQKWLVAGETRIVLTSLRKIAKGEEVTYNYHFYDDGFPANPILAQQCRCGSVFCCGKVGGSHNSGGTNSGRTTSGASSLSLSLSSSQQEIESAIERGDTLLTTRRGGGTSEGSGSSVEAVRAFVTAVEESEWIKRVSGMTSSSSNSSNVYAHTLQRQATTLRERLRVFDEWERETLSILRGERQTDGQTVTGFIDRNQLEALLGRCPLARSSTEKQAKQRLDAHHTACVMMREKRLCCGLLYERETIPVTTSTSTSVVSGISWDDYSDLVKACAACLPLSVPHLDWLLSLYHSALLWSQKWVLPLTKSLDVAETRDKTYWALNSLYTQCVGEIEGEALSMGVFSANDFLDEIVTMHLIRTPLKGEVEVERGGGVGERERQIQREIAVLIERERKRLLGDGERDGEREEIVCYCQLPERHSLYSVCTQCTQCNGWFHLPCNNSRSLSASTLSKGDVNFMCNLCLVCVTGRVSCFAFKPSTEWKYPNSTPNTTDRKSATTTTSATTAVVKTETKEVDPLGYVPKKRGPRPKAVVTDNITDNNSASNVICNTNNTVTTSLSPLDEVVQSIAKTQSMRIRRAQHFLTTEDVEKALREGDQSLACFSFFPAKSLLGMAQRAVADWGTRVDSFFSPTSESVRVCDTVIVPIIEGRMPESERDFDEVLPRVFREAVHLYFEPLNLRIKCNRRLGRLREYLWTVSALPLFYPRLKATTTCTTESIMSVHTHNEDGTTVPQSVPVLLRPYDLSLPLTAPAHYSLVDEIAQAGRLLVFTDANTEGVTHAQTVSQRVLQAVETLNHELRALVCLVQQCRSVESAMKLLPLLLHPNGGSTVMKCFYTVYILSSDVSELDYAIARVKCFVRPKQVRLLEREKLTDGEREGESESKREEDDGVYCLCRRGDDGSAMICCDRCDDWFHLSCVGLGSGRKRRRRRERGDGEGEREGEKEENATVLVGAGKRKGTTASSKREREKAIKKVVQKMLQGEQSGYNARGVEGIEDSNNTNSGSNSDNSQQYLCISCSAIQNVDYPYAW